MRDLDLVSLYDYTTDDDDDVNNSDDSIPII